MTNQQHPITPAPELVQQWEEECESGNNSEVSNTFDALQWFASKAARWGADQELEACCKWLAKPEVALTGKGPADLRDARRPKPPSLKEQALETLKYPKDFWSEAEVDTIRRALEALPE